MNSQIGFGYEIPETSLEDIQKMGLVLKYVIDNRFMDIFSDTSAEHCREFVELISSFLPKGKRHEFCRVMLEEQGIKIDIAYLTKILNCKIAPSAKIVLALAKHFKLSIFDCYVSTGFFQVSPNIDYESYYTTKILFDTELATFNPYPRN